MDMQQFGSENRNPNNRIKLSVLITTYNLEKYVAETLDSVLAQKTTFSYEILVGDDGSSDGTRKVVERYQERYPGIITLYVMDRDPTVLYDRIERASKNRINLIRHAKGEYLIFLDGDDWYIDDTKLQKQVDALDAPKNADCILCAHNICTYYSEQDKKLINTCNRKRKITPQEYWKYGMYFHSDTVMFRNIYKGDFPTTFPAAYYDDNEIVYCLLQYGKFLYLPDVMVNYRQVANSSWNSVDALEKCIINLLSFELEHNYDGTFLQAGYYRHLYEILFMRRNYKQIPKGLLAKYLPRFEEFPDQRIKQWLCFGEQSFGKRLRMDLWLMAKLFCFVFIKLYKTLPKNRMNA